MVFSSLLFLFYFLPAVLVVYFLVPRRFKNVVLLVFSLAFYGWGEPVYVLLMVFSILMDYSLGRWMHTRLEKGNVRAAGGSWCFRWCANSRCWPSSNTPIFSSAT